MKISHEIEKPSTTYEPFYVSADEIPAFDERFLGYDFDRSSQVLCNRVLNMAQET